MEFFLCPSSGGALTVLASLGSLLLILKIRKQVINEMGGGKVSFLAQPSFPQAFGKPLLNQVEKCSVEG